MALHRAVAARLRADPTLVQTARARVEMWRDRGIVADYYVEAWASLLSEDASALCDALVEDTERGHTLRQVSPFAGVLKPRERWAILRSLGRT